MLKIYLFNPRLYRSCCRSIFSRTGTWEAEVSLESKLEIEQHWQSSVANSNVEAAAATAGKPKFYVLAMFPYPSGSLHMGHARVYTISDTIARFHRMRGKHVIHPMGWDSFGLPAENAARDRGVDPAVWTRDNIASMRAQLLRLGLCLDWNREIDTSSPEYYAGTQRIFLQLWSAGLVYQDQSVVNWDPVDLTVLADEQVDTQGNSWRSGAKVERRFLTQWFIRTTRFARQLLEGLDSPLLEDWRDIVQLQKHWIGPCDGTLISLPLISQSGDKVVAPLKVWTRCPEEGGLFVSVSRSHPLNSKQYLCEHQPSPETGLLLSLRASNPLHNTFLPLVVVDKEEKSRDDCGYMGVASSETDRQLAQQLGLGVGEGEASPAFSMTKQQAMNKARELGIGGHAESSHLRDWLISRQRRWGTPIPLVKCQSCGIQPVADAELPVTLPETSASLDQWKATTCPKCGEAAERETDTMDTFVDSSWYFLRFLDPHNSSQPFHPETVAANMPVDLYVGGKEHAVLHLYYARFMAHFLHSIGWLPEPEPFRRLLVQGMVMGKSFQVKESGKYLPATSVITEGKESKEKETGLAVTETWEKMSKSKHNGTDPNAVLSELGCDATRLLLLADVAPTSHRKWSADTYPGILNWQHRLWLTVGDFMQLRQDSSANQKAEVPASSGKPLSETELAAEEARLWDSRNFYVSGTTFNFCVSQQLSVAVTKMQGLTNSLRRTPKALISTSVQYERALAVQIAMLAPMAPHFASELWAGFTAARPMLSNDFDWDKDVLQQDWPELDHDYKLDFTIQLNHTDQCCLKVPLPLFSTMTQDRAVELALSRPEVQTSLGAWTVVGSELEVRPGYDMTLNLISVRPEGVERTPRDPKDKKKKKRKKLQAVEM